ncbi:hypothetical protein ADL27_41660, partial [Streptomyces sp. NRRL F-6602]
MLHTLSGPDGQARAMAVSALGSTDGAGDDDWREAFRAALDDTDAAVREAAVGMLSSPPFWMSDEEREAADRRAAADPDATVRLRAVLAQMMSRRYGLIDVQGFITATADEDAEVRRAALIAAEPRLPEVELS